MDFLQTLINLKNAPKSSDNDKKRKNKHKKGRNRKDKNNNSHYLSVWDHVNASWIPFDHILQTKIKISPKKSVNRAAMSKKYGGLDKHEIIMYETVVTCCDEYYALRVPHELLMMILIYSQGYKFESNDRVIYFPCGLFNGDYAIGKIKNVVDGENEYRIKRNNPPITNRVPFHHVFARYLVVINAELFAKTYGEKSIYGDVFCVECIRVIKEHIYSNKKKRNIPKLRVKMDVKRNFYVNNVGLGPKYMEVVYDTNIFLGAKYLKK